MCKRNRTKEEKEEGKKMKKCKWILEDEERLGYVVKCKNIFSKIKEI